MNQFQILFLALAFAFTWREVLKWGVTKPFNCMKCMTGWAAFFIALYFYFPHGWHEALHLHWLFHSLVYLFEGLFVGAMFEAIKMRWL